MKNILYVLCDNTLDPIYASVQGGHAIAEFLKMYSFYKWDNETVVYLSVDIDKWFNLLEETDAMFYIEWCEPDLNDKVTSIALLRKYQTSEVKKMLSEEELLK